MELQLWDPEDGIVQLAHSSSIDPDGTTVAVGLRGHGTVVLQNIDATLDGVRRVIGEPAQLPNRERLERVIEKPSEDVVRGFMKQLWYSMPGLEVG